MCVVFLLSISAVVRLSFYQTRKKEKKIIIIIIKTKNCTRLFYKYIYIHMHSFIVSLFYLDENTHVKLLSCLFRFFFFLFVSLFWNISILLYKLSNIYIYIYRTGLLFIHFSISICIFIRYYTVNVQFFFFSAVVVVVFIFNMHKRYSLFCCLNLFFVCVY